MSDGQMSLWDTPAKELADIPRLQFYRQFVLDDGCRVRVEFDSHGMTDERHLHRGEWQPATVTPHLDMHGFGVSDTGYRSMFGEMFTAEPEGGWEHYATMAVSARHAEHKHIAGFEPTERFVRLQKALHHAARRTCTRTDLAYARWKRLLEATEAERLAMLAAGGR